MANTGVLITGFPEPISERLVARLLEGGSRSRFVFVVEPALVFEAHDRCRELEGPHPHFAGRWQIAPGDLCQPDLGLSASALALVREQVGTIWHLGDSRWHLGDSRWHLADSRGRAVSPALADAYALDVTATTRVLELCETTPGLELLVYLSSSCVAGDRRGRVYEDELDEGQGYANPREQTKCWAELQVRQRWARIPTVVLRPSVVAELEGLEGRSGLDQPRARVNMVPLHWLVDAMVRLSEDPRARGRAFHLSDPRPPRVQELRDLCSPRAGLWTRTLARARRAVLGVPAAVGENHGVIYDLSNTAELLSELAPPCPGWEDYLPSPHRQARASGGSRS